MNFDTYSIVYLISNFFSIFIIRRFAEAFFKKQSNYKIVSVLLYLIYFIITSLAYLKLDIPIIALCINWISIFVIFFTYESTIQKRIVYTTYIIAFMLFPELVIGAITGYFKFSFFSEGNYSSEIGIISTKIITYIEALLFRYYRIRKDSQSVSTSLWISTIIIPLSTLIYECMFVSNDNLTKDKVIASVAMLFIINVTAFHLYDSLTKSYVQQSKLSILETENALYSKQCEIMQSSTEELQGFRHDMNNQFIALSQLIKSEQYGDAERQLSHLTLLTKSKIIYSTSGNVIIDGLINYKTAKYGKVAAVAAVSDEDDIILISESGIIIRMSVSEISTFGRPSKGVKVMKLAEDDKVISMVVTSHVEEEEEAPEAEVSSQTEEIETNQSEENQSQGSEEK